MADPRKRSLTPVAEVVARSDLAALLTEVHRRGLQAQYVAELSELVWPLGDVMDETTAGWDAMGVWELMTAPVVQHVTAALMVLDPPTPDNALLGNPETTEPPAPSRKSSRGNHRWIVPRSSRSFTAPGPTSRQRFTSNGRTSSPRRKKFASPGPRARTVTAWSE